MIHDGFTMQSRNTHDPKFVKRFVFDYFFEETQYIKLSVYDEDKKDGELSEQELIGEVEFRLCDLVLAPNQKLQVPLPTSKTSSKSPSVTICAEEVVTCKQILTLKLRGINLDKKGSTSHHILVEHQNSEFFQLISTDFFGKSDPYLEFHRLREDGSFVKVLQTNVEKNTLNPKWSTISVHLQHFCNGDLNRPILVRCFDWNRNSEPDFIGEYRDLAAEDLTKPGFEFPLINPEKKNQKKYTGSGRILVETASLQTENSFIDYIRGGCQVSVIVAIDFTASNGDPNSSDSLHFRDGFTKNPVRFVPCCCCCPSEHVSSVQYEWAIEGICDIVAPYDSDEKFPGTAM